MNVCNWLHNAWNNSTKRVWNSIQNHWTKPKVDLKAIQAKLKKSLTTDFTKLSMQPWTTFKAKSKPPLTNLIAATTNCLQLWGCWTNNISISTAPLKKCKTIFHLPTKGETGMPKCPMRIFLQLTISPSPHFLWMQVQSTPQVLATVPLDITPINNAIKNHVPHSLNSKYTLPQTIPPNMQSRAGSPAITSLLLPRIIPISLAYPPLNSEPRDNLNEPFNHHSINSLPMTTGTMCPPKIQFISE